jgi:mannose-6-phosphate isomerase-like protein (cupin superfamily)
MQATDTTAPFMIGPGEGEATWFQPNRMVVKATGETTGGGFGLLESWVRAGASPPLHVHRREDESFWILEGRVRFRCQDKDLIAGPGSFVFLPRDLPHTFVVEGDEDAHLLTLLTPGGGERFFVEGGRTPEGPGLPPPGPPDVARLREVAPMYGAEIVGPPLAPGAETR